MDQDFDLPQLPPSLSLEELLSKAEKEDEKVQDAIPTVENPFDEDADDIKPARKIKRDVKMTEQMLMSDSGFKYLIKEIKRQKFKGSGHEIYKEEVQRNHFKRKHGIITEDNTDTSEANKEPEPRPQVEVLQETVTEISTQQKELIEAKKQLALEKLTKRKEERELMKRREREQEEENIARMIAESGHLFGEE
ncbi:hypothetical protein HK103_005091 [Boothiomyces macroporosus]|uniref:Uncharacterized protein n=1 Tax=Boothiomyces macroporosus TaxID=261099 RepID=A0AAD5UFP2_9FUNG|nr:hypothetical protein HK103_005091 [Boothiomyces macroporosus]